MSLRFFPDPEPDEKSVREAAKRIADEKLRPFAIHDDEKSFFRRDVFNAFAKEKLSCLTIPTQYGGAGSNSRCYYGALEEVARASLAMTVTLGVTNLVQGALVAFGTEAQRERFLKPLCRGELLGAFSLSEPQSGSDASALRCAAKKVDGGYRVTGNKIWCSTAGNADVYLLMARTGEHKIKGISAFLVPKETPGFRVGKQEDKLGMRASSLAELIFEDAFLGDELRVGAEGEGFQVALNQLDSGRITIGAAGVGLAIEALVRAWRFRMAKDKDGTLPFDEGSRLKLAVDFGQIQAVKSLINEAARLKDAGQKFTVLASQAKMFGSDLGMRVTSHAVSAMLPWGYTKEYEVERLMRDAKALQIVEGTNQIQQLVLMRELERMLA